MADAEYLLTEHVQFFSPDVPSESVYDALLSDVQGSPVLERVGEQGKQYYAIRNNMPALLEMSPLAKLLHEIVEAVPGVDRVASMGLHMYPEGIDFADHRDQEKAGQSPPEAYKRLLFSFVF